MTKSIENQLSWSAGEWSPLLDARVDNPKYRHACRQLQNMIVMKQGGATRRPGTRYIGTAKYASNFSIQNNATRLMKFQFSPTTSFVLEFGNKYVRFYSNKQPVMINTAPDWSAALSYAVGDFVRDTTDHLIYYCIAAVSGSTQPHSDATHWVQQNIYEVPSPYSGVVALGSDTWSADVFTVVPCQINDVVYLVHPNYPPYKLTRISDSPPNWTMDQVNFMTPPLLDQNTTSTFMSASATTGDITVSANAPGWYTSHFYQPGDTVDVSSSLYICTVAHISGTWSADLAAGKWENITYFNSGHIGSTWQLSYLRNSSSIALDITGNATSATSIEARGQWELHTYGVWSADVTLQRTFDNGINWENVRTITGRLDRNADVKGIAVKPGTYRIVVNNWTAPATPGASTPRAVFEVVDALVSGLVKITGIINPNAVYATVITPLDNTNGTIYWSEGAWSNYRGYPQAVTSFQQRVIYGGSSYEPQRIWGSVTNDIENFDRGDQTLATDSFAFDLAAVGRGPIQWLIAQTDLFVGFSGAEWVVNSGSSSSNGGSSGAAITPTAVNAVEHSSWGSAPNVQPAIVGNAVLYPQRAERTIQQMLFSIYTQKYMSADLTSLSEHLFGKGMAQIDYQPQFRNQGIVWVITKSNSLCGMTYQLEQEIFGWARHITGGTTDKGFESIAVVEGQGVADDEVWVVVNRRVDGADYRYIELIDPTVWETQSSTTINGIAQPEIKNAFYVDCGITVTSPGTNVITGLSYIKGRSVVGLINGNTTFGPLTVSAGGTITIPNYTATSGDVLQVGLPINYAVQAMRLDSDPRGGVLQGLTKALSKLYLRVTNSLGGNISDGGAKSVPVNYRTVLTPLGQGPAIYTGEKAVAPFSNAFDNDPVYVIQGSDALPLTLLAVAVKYDIAGSP